MVEADGALCQLVDWIAGTCKHKLQCPVVVILLIKIMSLIVDDNLIDYFD